MKDHISKPASNIRIKVYPSDRHRKRELSRSHPFGVRRLALTQNDLRLSVKPSEDSSLRRTPSGGEDAAVPFYWDGRTPKRLHRLSS